jgi:WD repeat-containing protein 26
VRHLKTTFKTTLRVVGALFTSTCRRMETDDDDLESRVHGPPTTSQSQMYDPARHQLSDVTAFIGEPSTPTSPLVPPTPLNSPVDQEYFSSFAATSSTDPTTTVGKQLWKNAFQNIKMSNALTLTQLRTAAPVPPLRRRTSSSSFQDVIPDNKNKTSTSTSESVLFNRPRISAFVPKLIEMKLIYDLAAHSALVRQMQFSPDGQFLATSR